MRFTLANVALQRIGGVVRLAQKKHDVQMRRIQASLSARHRMENIPDIKTFIKNTATSKPRNNSADTMVGEIQDPHSIDEELIRSNSVDLQTEISGRRFFIETYGCQMNVSDTEIVHAVLEGAGLVAASSPEEANIILVNTCAVMQPREYQSQ